MRKTSGFVLVFILAGWAGAASGDAGLAGERRAGGVSGERVRKSSRNRNP